MFAVVLSVLALSTPEPSIPGASNREILFQEVIEEALARNPDVQSFEPERRAVLERAEAAGSLPHPTLGFAVRSLPVPSFSFREDEMTSADVLVRQQLPWFGKRRLRKEAEGAGAAVVESTGENFKLLLAEEAAVRFSRLWLAVRSEEVIRRQGEAMGRLVSLTRQRLPTGSQGQSDLLLAEAELARLGEPLLSLREEEAAARAGLGALLSLQAPMEGRPVDPPGVPLPDLAALLATLDRHPELLALGAQKEQARLQAALARKERLPDPEVGLSYGVRTVHPDMVGIEVTFPIPLFASSKEDRLAAASEAEAEAIARRWQGRRDALASEMRGAWERARSERERMALYEEELLPRWRRGVEASIASYLSGRVDFLTVVDAQVQVFRQEIETMKAEAAYLIALAGLARASGDLEILFPTGRGVSHE